MNTSNPAAQAAQAAQPDTARRSAASAVSATTSDHSYEQWETVAVTPIPTGWRNVYRNPDGSTHALACPALLLQEHRANVYVWGSPSELRTRAIACEHPYATRVVYGADDEFGTVGPVDDISNYVGTWPPGEAIPTEMGR